MKDLTALQVVVACALMLLFLSLLGLLTRGLGAPVWARYAIAVLAAVAYWPHIARFARRIG